MQEIQKQVEEALRYSAERLRNAGLSDTIIKQLEHLAEQVYQNCVIAVAGRVKAGKSTFVNALLNENLAKVGETEMTATINYFRYGVPSPDLPVRCYWRGGECTEKPREFLDRLQGHDLATLRLSQDIDHLEYYVQNPRLQNITLVDTPGTDTVVEEHNKRSTDFFKISAELRERHHKETERIQSEADAVIYVLGEVARESQEAFLQAFLQATQNKTRSMNTLGVIAKIDLNPEIVARRFELSQKIADQLSKSLNTVIPVSAGLHLALNRIADTDPHLLKHLTTILRSLPLDSSEYMLTNQSAFLEEEYPEFPEEERRALINMIDWPILATIGRVILNLDLADEVAIEQELRAIAGFDALNVLLEQHFLRRGRLLRCYRIINDAQNILNEVRYTYLPTFQENEWERRMQKERFKNLLQKMRDPVAREMETFIDEHLAPHLDLEVILKAVERKIAYLKVTLEVHNKDFENFQLVEEHYTLFTEAESTELHQLFGNHTLEIEQRLPIEQRTSDHIFQRIEYWEDKSQQGTSDILRRVAAYAAHRYNTILDVLFKENMPCL